MKVPARLSRLDRRIGPAVVVVVAVAAAVAVLVGGMVLSDDRAGRSVDDSAASEASGDGPGEQERRFDRSRPGGTETPTDPSPSPPSTPTTVTGEPSTTLPPTTAVDVEPASPPATGPSGMQGPVRRQPCASSGPPAGALPVVDVPTGDGRSWVTVAQVDGNCGGTSAEFATRGIDTRLLYRSDAEQLLVYIDDVVDIDTAAGYADVECRSSCADEQLLTLASGRYRLRIEATDAPWEVVVQEYR